MTEFARRRGKNGVLCRLCLATVIGCVVAATAWAQAPEKMHDYALPAASLTQSVNAIGQSNGVQVIYDAALLKGKTAGPISGHLTLSQALDKALAGSGLTYELVNDGHTVVIRKASPPPTEKSRPQESSKGNATKTNANTQPTTLSTVAVTGTRIRGGTTPSELITIGAQQIQDEGFSDLGQVIRNIPQNFSGGQNPGVTSVSGGQNYNQNITGGSGMNLRGLGPDATLTLLNGHRMAYGGFSQAVDISAIPVDAVERIEIVPDGASAIYGSDAVGGVANVILKRDFNGVTVGARYGGATDGGLVTHSYTATAGTTWATGGLIAAGEKTFNDPIYSNQRDYTQSMYQPSTLWQGSNLRSGVFSLHQSLGDAVELHLDALDSDWNIHTDQAYPSIYYPYNVETKTTLLAPSLEVWLPGDWTLTLSGAVGKEKNSAAEPTVSRADGAITALSLAYRNKSLTYEIGAEGPLFTLPGGEARLAAGAGYRYNDFLYLLGNTINTGGDESSRFAYAELDLPLVGPEQDIGGIERLELTGAVRTEDGDYGRVTTPKFGVIYSPNTDFSLKASWGKSFKAPTLLQRYETKDAYLWSASEVGASGLPADATALESYGGNADLRPERARTWSASLAFHPEAVPRLETELTWFHINYIQRVLQPIAALNNVFGNPAYADFVDYDPTEAAKAAVFANAGNFYNFVGTPYDASKVVAIIDDRYVNAVQQRIKGIDLSGSYRVDLGKGRLTIRGSASWLDSTQALTAAQVPYDLAGTLFNPARINSRIGAVWQQGGFTVSLFGNYKGGVTDTADDRKGASFTTFDAMLRYDTGARDDAWSHLALELSVQNLLDRAPPLYTPISPTYTPYDSTNYSAVGRFVSVSVSKHW